MPKALSREAIQRGTYLHERHISEQPGAYDAVLAVVNQQMSQRQDIRPWLELLTRQADKQFQAADDDTIPAWAAFLDTLSASSGLGHDDVLSDSMQQFLKEEVYAAPFRSAANSMAIYLDQFSTYCDGLHMSEIIERLLIWHVKNLRDTARFVLHLSYLRSKSPYSVWTSLFSGRLEASDEWHNLAHEFPLMLRALATIDQQARSAMSELFRRLSRDRIAIAQTFNIAQDCLLTSIIPGLSDRHHDGRTVMKLVFASGASLIYKPKAMKIEQSFNTFISGRLEASGIDAIKVIDAGNYGWAEDVEQEASLELRDLASKVGRASALLWLINATDLHFENVRLGERGVRVLDLETLLTAPVSGLPSMHDYLWRRHSINSTFLFRGNLRDNDPVRNLAGFHQPGVKARARPLSGFEIKGDEVVIIASRKQKVLAQDNTEGERADPIIAQQVTRSFRDGAAFIARELLDHFLCSVDDDCPLRFIARETDFYYQLLDRARQPRFLRDAALLEFDLLQLHLGVPPDSPSCEQMHMVIADERRQILRGDVPYLGYTAGGTSIMTSKGYVPEAFSCSGKDYAKQKLEEFEASDVEEQLALISIALRDFQALSHARPTFSEAQVGGAAASADQTLANTLYSLALDVTNMAFLPASSPARWLTLAGGVSPENLKAEGGDSTLFSGTWGILLGLQGIETAISPWVDTQPLVRFLDLQASLWEKSFGSRSPAEALSRSGQLGLAGLGGDIFAFATLSHLSKRWNFLTDQIEPLLQVAKAAITADRSYDVLSGSAGLILACEEVARRTLSKAVASSAIQLQMTSARHLIEAAVSCEGGKAWVIPGQTRALLGFAHGWAGIMTALACASMRADINSTQSRIDLPFKELLAYPMQMLNNRGRWEDLRTGLVDHPLNESWCNGKTGFVRGMLTFRNRWSPQATAEIERIIEEMLSEKVGLSYRFCCGRMGIIDFLIDYSSAVGRSDLKTLCHNQALDLLQSIPKLDVGVITQLLPEVCFAGLFQGKSGIGYTAARLLNADLPSLSGQMCYGSIM